MTEEDWVALLMCHTGAHSNDGVLYSPIVTSVMSHHYAAVDTKRYTGDTNESVIIV